MREDFLIREFLHSRLLDAGLESVEIERFPGKLHIIISTSRPGLVIGRGGSGIDLIRRSLHKHLAKYMGEEATSPKETSIDIREVKNPWESAPLTAQWIVQQLEKRMPHRRVLKQTLGKVMANKGIEGARIEVAGRLGGSDMKRRERVEDGRLPRQTIRARIDYSLREAKTKYGTIGVKVWLYRGESFDD